MNANSVTEIALNGLLIFAFSFATGFGLSNLLVTPLTDGRSLRVLMPVGFGFMQIAIVDAYLINASEPISMSIPICTIIGACTAVVYLIIARKRHREFRFEVWLRGFLNGRTLLGAGLLLLVLAPILNAGLATTPYRIGIDQVGYAETAQFLVEDGTIASAQAKLFAELGTSDVSLAEKNNLKSLSFNTYVDTEFLLKALRWGFPGTVATLTEFTGAVHVFRIEFLILIFSYALVMALTFRLMSMFFGMSELAAVAVTVVVALNCNLLNVYYEGQLAQIFIAPFFLLLFMLFLYARKWRSEPNPPGYSSPILIRSVALFALLVMTMLSSYNESVLLLIGLMYLIMLLDVLIYRRTGQKAALIIVGGYALGAIGMFPISRRWISYTFANLGGLAHAGFWQPHWGSLAEILGLLDMYVQPGYSLLARSPVNEAIMLASSVVAVAVVFVFLVQAKNVDRTFWVAPFIVVAAEYAKMKYVDLILNYSYMKIYTLLLPLLVPVCFAALYWIVRSRPRLLPYVFYGATLLVSATGVSYIDRYVSQEHFVTKDMFALYRPGGTRLFDEDVVITHSPALPEFMLVPLISMNWVDENFLPKIISPHMSKHVVAILKSADLTCRTCLAEKFASRVLVENPGFVAFDTGMTLAQLCPVDPKLYDLDQSAQIAGRPNLPGQQCNYSYADKLPWVTP